MARPESQPFPGLGSLAVAGAFLTRLPLRSRAGDDPEALARAAFLFPLVGAGIGLAAGAAALGLVEVLPAFLAGLLAVALELALTGALHADGLADSADGLGGSDRERSLAIMRDHTLGTYGACALAIDLALKAAALGALAEADALGPVVAALAISRATPLALGRHLPYARAGEGTGRLLAGRVGTASVLIGTGLALALAVATAGTAGLALFACAAAVTAAVGLLAYRRLGGVTGDVMGAAIELSATLALVLAVALKS
ncbi:MAG TPA: adenosylcobinamide-GDP ribazoletransferase [Solirubrobacterales bacterium]|nr:adenosylcobinamide-GDP ribazoletransferase [Solirubrobacterales bacterium]